MKEKQFETAFDSYHADKVLGGGGSGTVYRVTSNDGKQDFNIPNPNRIT